MFNIESILTKHTTDGVVDYSKINGELKNQVDGIIKKSVQNETKLKEQFQSELIKDLGFEDVHALKEKLSSNFTANDSKYNDLKTKFDEQSSTIDSLKVFKTKATNLERTQLLKDAGYNDKYQVSGILQELSSKTDDSNTFESVLENFIKENPAGQKAPTSTAKPITQGNEEKSTWETMLEDRNGIKF